MPTVSDILRTHLVGDGCIDFLEQWLATNAARTVKSVSTIDSAEPHGPKVSDATSSEPSRVPLGFLGIILGMGLKRGKPIEYLDELPQSSGYEQLFLNADWTPGAARGIAALAVQHGRRHATESKRFYPVLNAIRFLGARKRQVRAILPRARLLLAARRETSIIETIFYEAGQSEFEFIHLLKSTIDGRDTNRQRITDIASSVSPNLPLVRGPKIRASSAAHEFLLRQGIEFANWDRSAACRNDAAESVNPLTAATRLEFGNLGFDSRPAQRRATRRTANLVGNSRSPR